MLYIAQSHFGLGDSEKAFATLEQAIALSRSIDSAGIEASALFNKGFWQVEQDQLEEGIASYQRAAELYTSADDQQSALISTFRAYMTEGQNYTNKASYKEASKAYKEASNVARKYIKTVESAEDSETVALRITRILIPAYNNSAYLVLPSVQSSLKEGKHEALHLADSLNQQTLTFISEALSLAYNTQSEDTIKELNQYADVAYVLAGSLNDESATFYEQEGEYGNALAAQKRALEQYQAGLPYAIKSNEPNLVLRSKARIASTLRWIGYEHRALQQYEEGIAAVLEGLNLAEDISAREIELSSYWTLSLIHWDLSNSINIDDDHAQAMEYAEKSLEYSEKMLSLAEKEVQVAGKDFPEGYVDASFIDSETDQQYQIQKALHSSYLAASQIAYIYIDQYKYLDALEERLKVLSIAERFGERNNILDALEHVSQSYGRVGNYKKALEFAQRAATFAKEEDIRASSTESILAGAYESLGRYSEAVEAYEQALSLAVDEGNVPSQLSINNNLMIIQAKQGQYDSFFQGVEQSLKLIRGIREQVLSATNFVELASICGLNDILNKDKDSLLRALMLGSSEVQKQELASRSQEIRFNQFQGAALESLREQCLEVNWNLEYKQLNSIGSIRANQGRFQEAMAAHEQALAIVEKWNDTAGRQSVLGAMAAVYHDIGDYDKSLDLSQQSLSLAEEIGDQAEVAIKLNNIGVVHDIQGRPEQALKVYDKSLQIAKETGARDFELTALSNISDVRANYGQFGEAETLMRQALEIAKELGSLHTESELLRDLSELSHKKGDYDIALQQIEQSLVLAQKVGLRPLEGQILKNKGEAHQAKGEFNEAFDAYESALEIADSLEAINAKAYALISIGSIYNQLGQYNRTTERYQEAFDIFDESGNLPGKAIALEAFGTAAEQRNKDDEALGFYEQALDIHKRVGNPERESAVLTNIGFLKSENDLPEARAALQRSLEIQDRIGIRSNKANTLVGLALVEQEDSRLEEAFSLLQQALALHQELGDRPGEAAAQFELASLYASQDQLSEALAAVNSAISQVESLRTSIRTDDLRTSYFSTVQDYYQLKTDLLMKLDQPEAAFEANESARARTLTELLNEANVDIRKGVDPDLLSKEEALRSHLQQVEARRISVLSGQHTSTEEKALDTESDGLLQQLDQVIAQIRSNSPAYAELIAPQPLSFSEAQQVLDADTVLVQYALGEEQSYLWIVGKGETQVYTLPGEQEIQDKAKIFRNTLTTKGSNQEVKRAGDALMTLILPERPEWLKGKRLLVVGDGMLSEIPFTALPLPDRTEYVPLLVEHEILSQPSITAIDVLRKQLINRPEQSDSIAVMADPVYRVEDDDRLSSFIATRANTKSVEGTVERSLRSLDFSAISRLPYTRQEAENIETLASLNNIESTLALDFDANFDWLTDERLSQYGTIHLATHGFINPTNPQLSGVVLSLVDKSGSSREDGLLRLHDIFNLNLPAKLVVLSACQTGIGENISGEGVIGLSRGFMYAGAERVAVSLWNVEDESTADLVALFYKYMLSDKLSPAAAMRAAQLKQWEAGKTPHSWAAFTLQGEWL